MSYPFRKKLLAASLMAAGSAAAVPAMAQETPPGGTAVYALEEIVVTARRREETLQDVPITVNAVTGEEIKDLNIREFDELQAVVAGLTLSEDSVAPAASMRGVRFDTFASGNNATVEFYLNDAPISSAGVMQALFDVGQIEVLRGPQGTLRGRASPSGSITITTRKPILDEFGGYIDLTASDLDGRNARGALNIPVIQNQLAVRFAGFWEENNYNNAESVFTGDDSEYEGHGYRFSVAYQPTDTLSIDGMYQKMEPDRIIYYPAETATIANPNLPPSDPSNPFIEADDRYSVQDNREIAEQQHERWNLNVSWDIGAHQMNYVYSKTEFQLDRLTPWETDPTNAIDQSLDGTPFPAFGLGPDDWQAWQGLRQELHTGQDSESHEIRFQSLEPLFDRVDYVVGFFTNDNEPPSDLINITPLALFVPTGNPAMPYVPLGAAVPGQDSFSVSETPIARRAESEEKSVFANLTFLLTDFTELSVGARRIDYEEESSLVVAGTELIGPNSVFGQDGAKDFEETIYSASLKHEFSEDLMAYFSYGTSWRPGIFAVGDFSFVKSDLQESFQELPPEESESFEVGMRSSWLDQRLRLNVSLFHQEFDNYPYRSGGLGVYYQFIDRNGARVEDFNFVAGVPVEVDGGEIEATFQATDNWNLGLLYSYAKGEIDNGLIPCNDYLPHDGVPDRGGAVPTLGDIQAAAGADNLTACEVGFRSNYAPLWTATVTSQYDFVVGDMDAYVRGLWTLYGDSDNDPTNPVDDVDAYNTLNLYLGLSDPAGAWEAMLYGKNVFDTEEIITRRANPGSISYTGVDVSIPGSVPELGGNVVSDYRLIEMTPPREIGVNFRYNFNF